MQEELTLAQQFLLMIPVVIVFSIVATAYDLWKESRMRKKGYYYRRGGWVKY